MLHGMNEELYLEELIDKQDKKVPAKPIPENYVKRFAYRLEEMSKDFEKRNMMLYMIGIGTGYRMQDLVDLTIGDIKEALEMGYFEIQEKKQYNAYLTHIKKNPNSKRKPPKKRKAIISSSLSTALTEYVKGKRKSQYAFESKKGKHISSQSFSRILREVAKTLDLNAITGHSLRKTYARRIYDRTGNIERVRQRLGHKSVETTKEYIGLYDEEMKEDASLFDDLLDF